MMWVMTWLYGRAVNLSLEFRSLPRPLDPAIARGHSPHQHGFSLSLIPRSMILPPCLSFNRFPGIAVLGLLAFTSLPSTAAEPVDLKLP